MKLLMFKKNPDRIPGHGGKERLTKESDIEVIDMQSLNVGDKVFIASEYFNIMEIEVLKIRWDKKAITHEQCSTLSYGGNPFGASSSYAEYNCYNKFPLFPTKEDAEKFCSLVKEEIGKDKGGSTMCPVSDHDESKWKIARSYAINDWV